MKRWALATLVVVFGVGVLWGCASLQTWPENERSAENKMGGIQARIGDGLKTGALTPDESQSYLTKLKIIQTDYAELRGKTVYREKWDNLLARLDALEAEIDRTLARAPRLEEPRTAERIVALQRTIDEGRVTGRLPQAEGRDYQARLDAIRSDASRMTANGRSTTLQGRDSLRARLDALEAEIDRTLARAPRLEEPRTAERIVALQRTIDEGRLNRRLPAAQGREYQARLDAIRNEYSQMTAGGRTATYDARTDISRRLDFLEGDLNR